MFSSNSTMDLVFFNDMMYLDFLLQIDWDPNSVIPLPASARLIPLDFPLQGLSFALKLGRYVARSSKEMVEMFYALYELFPRVPVSKIGLASDEGIPYSLVMTIDCSKGEFNVQRILRKYNVPIDVICEQALVNL